MKPAANPCDDTNKRFPIFGRSHLLGLLIFLLAAVPAWAEDDNRLSVVSWAPTSGPEALWHEALGGLKTAAALFNAHGGLGGRPLGVIELRLDENSPGFFPALNESLSQPGVLGLTGGPARAKAGPTADYLRRLNRVWFGPWSDEKELYKGEPSDPFAVLPPWTEEIPALLSYVRTAYQSDPGRSGPVFLVYYDAPSPRAMAAEARRMASEMGLELQQAPIAPDFAAWDYLADHVKEAGAVLVWLNPGASAALVNAAKARRPDTIYMTNSVNATNRSLVVISGGAWNGVVFPAILSPSRDISTAYADILRKYGPVGLDGGYQAFVGFAQGQILARATNLGLGQNRMNLTRNLYDMKGFPSLLSAPVNYALGRHVNRDAFYLGRGYGNGYWEAAPAPKLIGGTEKVPKK